jgi:hypothetical protein
MSNNIVGNSIIRFTYRATGLFLILSVLALSLRMTIYGASMIAMDMTELSSVESNRRAKDIALQSCIKWVDSIGMRLICRKLISERLYQDIGHQVDQETVDESIKDVLRVSPLEPAYWLALADTAILRGDDVKKILEYSRMSYVTGRSQQLLMQRRLSIMLSIWDELSDTDKSVAINDYIYSSVDERTELLQSLNLMTEIQQAEFLHLIMRRNSNLGEDLKHSLKIQ